MAAGSANLVVTGQEGLERRGQQPHLHDQQHRDQRDGAVDRRQAAVRGPDLRAHDSLVPRSTPTAHSSPTSLLEHDARQRPRRRALQDAAVVDREVALVAGALEPLAVLRRKTRARQVRALLAVGHERVRRPSAAGGRGRWRPGSGRPSRRPPGSRPAGRRPAPAGGSSRRQSDRTQDPDVAREHAEAGEDEELPELAARHVALLGRVDR